MENYFSFEVDASRIKRLYIERGPVEATRVLLDLVFSSETLGKWKSFEESLESAGIVVD